MRIGEQVRSACEYYEVIRAHVDKVVAPLS